MNYNFFKKIFIIIFILLVYIIKFNIPQSLAAEGLDNIISGGDAFILEANKTIWDNDKMKNVSDTIYNILLSTGVIIAVVIATILGIQYMTSAVEDKAEVKESMIPFIVGCIIVFGAFAIWKAIVTVLK